MDRLAGFDAINSVPGGLIGVQMASLWLTRMLVPGRELPDDAVWQAVEAEDMTVADYDDLIEAGWPAFSRAFLPRVLDLDEIARSDACLDVIDAHECLHRRAGALGSVDAERLDIHAAEEVGAGDQLRQSDAATAAAPMDGELPHDAAWEP